MRSDEDEARAALLRDMWPGWDIGYSRGEWHAFPLADCLRLLTAATPEALSVLIAADGRLEARPVRQFCRAHCETVYSPGSGYHRKACHFRALAYSGIACPCYSRGSLVFPRVTRFGIPVA